MKLQDDAAVAGVEDDIKRIIAIVTPIAGLLASVLGALGGLTGSFTRTVRNEPHLVWFAAGAVLIGFLFMAWAFFRYPGKTPASEAGRTRALSIALVAFAVAFFFSVLATVRTIHNEQDPSIDVAWNAATSTLSGTIRGGGFRSETQLKAAVYGMDGDVRDELPIWRSAASSDADGAVAIPVSVLAQAGSYDRLIVVAWAEGDEPGCTDLDDEEESQSRLRWFWEGPKRLQACAELAIPSIAGPVWDVKAITAEDGSRVLEGTLSGEVRPGESLLISIFSMADGSTLYAAEVTPRATAQLSVPISIDLGDTASVCLVSQRIPAGDETRIVGSETDCPPPGVTRLNAAWVELHLPRSVPQATLPETESTATP